MPVAGRKPKPEGQKRNRMKPTYEWVEVVDEPFEGGPSLPRMPRPPKPKEAPAPPRPLGTHGLELWRSGWRRQSGEPIDVDALLVLCEQMDERVALRVRVIRDGDWRARASLRALDAQVTAGLKALGVDPSAPGRLTEWPAETKRWWAAISSMPHCRLWTDADWQHAIDTAYIAAAFHAGDMRLAAELRAREKVMGTTADARRDLRIRYVPADEQRDRRDAEPSASVTAMDEYRRMVAGG
jgi:hypothetical protein